MKPAQSLPSMPYAVRPAHLCEAAQTSSLFSHSAFLLFGIFIGGGVVMRLLWGKGKAEFDGGDHHHSPFLRSRPVRDRRARKSKMGTVKIRVNHPAAWNWHINTRLTFRCRSPPPQVSTHRFPQDSAESASMDVRHMIATLVCAVFFVESTF